MVLKTAEQSPLSMQRVAELGGWQAHAGRVQCAQRGWPGGRSASGRAHGSRCTHLHRIHRRGSPLHALFGRQQLKRVHLELGGKSPNIILADAPDLEADSAAWAIFFNSGEMCTAGSRLYHADVADRVVERIVDTSTQWFPADPLLPDTKMGPLVDERSLQRVLGHLDRGLAEGVRCGSADNGCSPIGGAYLEPTVVTGAAPDNPLVREEIFGLRLPLRGTRRGGGRAGCRGGRRTVSRPTWTLDLGTAHRVSRALRVGIGQLL